MSADDDDDVVDDDGLRDRREVEEGQDQIPNLLHFPENRPSINQIKVVDDVRTKKKKNKSKNCFFINLQIPART